MPTIVNYGEPRTGGGGLPNVQPPWGSMSQGYGSGSRFGGFAQQFAGSNLARRKRLFDYMASQNRQAQPQQPGQPNYYVPEDSEYGEKPFNYGNVYGGSLPGGAGGGLPGFNPFQVRREDWANLTPQAQQSMIGASRPELERLSSATQAYRRGGFGAARQVAGAGQGFGLSDPSDALRRLLMARMGGGY